MAGTFSAAQPEEGHAAMPSAEYNCIVEPYGDDSWIPHEIGFTVKAQQADVFFPYFWERDKEPILAKVKERREGRLLIKWRVSAPTNLDFNTPVAYRVEFDPEQLAGKMYASVPLDNNARSGGLVTCTSERKR
ncbi:hypothetical protein [Leisingera sp. JC11]|uniref:hypothetical protein n=1 Tax=Leisingera sp. JC11 TaxID=3042469 RepID=UPI0034558B73